MATSADADIINQASADAAPEMPVPFDGNVVLLRGVLQEIDGVEIWHTKAKVRELNGEDEEFLSGLESDKELAYTSYMTSLLERAVLSIGDLKVADIPGMVNKLILPDRDMLFLAIVKSTYGTTRKMRAMCMHCQTLNDVEIDLNEDFKIVGQDMDFAAPIEVETSKGTVKLRYPNGSDTDAVQGSKQNDAQKNTTMIGRCSVWEAGKAPEDRDAWARTLNVPDRKALVAALLDLRAGPDMEGVETQCAECGQTMPILLDWVSLLLS